MTVPGEVVGVERLAESDPLREHRYGRRLRGECEEDGLLDARVIDWVHRIGDVN